MKHLQELEDQSVGQTPPESLLRLLLYQGGGFQLLLHRWEPEAALRLQTR